MPHGRPGKRDQDRLAAAEPGQSSDTVSGQAAAKKPSGAFANGGMAGCGRPGVQRTLNSARGNCKDAEKWWKERFQTLTRKDLPAAKAGMREESCKSLAHRYPK